MERSRDGRREYGRGCAAWVGAAPASGSGRIHPTTASGGAQHKTARGTRRVDENEPRGPDRKSRERMDEDEPCLDGSHGTDA